jgi:hypothetical protein
MTLLTDLPQSEQILQAALMNAQLTKAERDEAIEVCRRQGHYDPRTEKVGPVAFILAARKIIAARPQEDTTC